VGTLRRLLLTFLLAAGLLASAAGCGSNGSTGHADPARAAPADAAFYGEATIRPSGSLRDAVRSVARKVTLSPDPRAKLLKLIDRGGTRGASFERDIDPWLGSRAAAFVAGIGPGKPAAALIVGVRDEEKLSEALDRNERRSGKGTRKASYKGVEYRVDAKANAYGSVNGWLVAGTESGLRRVVDVTQGAPALAGSSSFETAKAKLPDQRLALLYLDVGRLLGAIAARAPAQSAQLEQIRTLYGLSGVRPVAAAVTATPDSVGVESAVTTTGQRPLAQPAASGGALLAGAPSDAWLVLGSANVGAAAKRGLGRLAGLGAAGLSTEQLKARLRARTGLDLDRDLLDWAGDAALFVRGTSKRDVSGALVIRASDPNLARRSIAKIAGAVRRFGHQPVRPETIEGAQGFSVAKPGAPRALVMLERGDEVVVAYGADSARAALAPSARLDSDPAFRSARGALAGGFSPSLYVAVAPILQLARSSGAGASPGFQRAAPYLDAYRFLVAGGRREGGTTHSRLVVGLR